MIGKIMQNHSFRATTDYVLNKEEASLIGGSMFGSNADMLAREFLMTRDRKLEVDRPVYHLTQSYSHQDAVTGNLDDDKLAEMAIRHFAGLVVASKNYELLKQEDKTAYRQKLEEFIEHELTNYQFFIAVHDDRQHKHTHIVASRISAWDGSVVATWKDRNHSQMVCREIERDFDLQQLQNSWEVGKRSLSRRQYETLIQTGDQAVQTQLQDLIDGVAKKKRGLTFEEFIQRLGIRGVEVRLTPRGAQIGISYALNGVAMRGSKLGRNYTYAGLQNKYGVGCEQPVDSATPSHRETIDRLKHKQAEYIDRLAPTIVDIWKRERFNRPDLKNVAFGEYQINAEGDRPPELFKRDQPLLRWIGDAYKSRGLTLQDCLAIEQFNQTSILQAAERDQKQAVMEVEETEKGRRQRFYANLYQQYAIQKSGKNITLQERDLLVGWRVLQAGEDIETIAAVLGTGSEQAKIIRRQQGREAGLEYLKDVMREVLKVQEKQLEQKQQTNRHDRDFEQ